MVEDVGLGKQLGEGRHFDDSKSMWLTSDSTYSSSFSEEQLLSGTFGTSVDEWVVSWLTNLTDSYVSLGEGITCLNQQGRNPILEASLAFEKTISSEQKILQEEMKEERGITSLLNSNGNDATDCYIDSPESFKTSCWQSCKDSMVSDNFLTPLSTGLDSSSQISGMDRDSVLLPLMNLDGEDSMWVLDMESELDFLQSGFPSPSSKTGSGSVVLSSNSRVSSNTEQKNKNSRNDLSLQQVSEAGDLKDFNSDEPLFWPFEWKFDLSSEDTWKFFSLSPRKDIAHVKAPDDTSPRFIRSQLHRKKMDLKYGCKRRLAFDAEHTESKMLGLKGKNNKNNNINDKNSVKRINKMPSRLRKWNKLSIEVVPLEMDDHIVKPEERKPIFPKSVHEDRNFLEDDFVSNKELPIEMVLGLNEFDGHEGIDPEFVGDVFLLDESL